MRRIPVEGGGTCLRGSILTTKAGMPPKTVMQLIPNAGERVYCFFARIKGETWETVVVDQDTIDPPHNRHGYFLVHYPETGNNIIIVHSVWQGGGPFVFTEDSSQRTHAGFVNEIMAACQGKK